MTGQWDTTDFISHPCYPGAPVLRGRVLRRIPAGPAGPQQPGQHMLHELHTPGKNGDRVALRLGGGGRAAGRGARTGTGRFGGRGDRERWKGGMSGGMGRKGIPDDQEGWEMGVKDLWELARSQMHQGADLVFLEPHVDTSDVFIHTLVCLAFSGLLSPSSRQIVDSSPR